MDQLKKRLGQTILSLNEDLLKLQKNYRILRVTTTPEGEKSESFKKATDDLETKVKEKKESLETTKKYLLENQHIMEERKLKKYLEYTTTTIDSVNKCLEMKTEMDADAGNTLDKTASDIKEAIDKESKEDSSLEEILKQLKEVPDVEENRGLTINPDVTEEEVEEGEFSCLSPHSQDRYNRRLYDIEKTFKDITETLKKKWKEGKILDSLALRDIKTEFDDHLKNFRYQASIWERKKKNNERLTSRLDDEIILIYTYKMFVCLSVCLPVCRPPNWAEGTKNE